MKTLKDLKPAEKDLKPTEEDYQPAGKAEGKPSKWITIPQGLLEDWWDDLDTIDGVIVGYIITWLKSKSPKVRRHPADDRFVWINLGSLLKCVPMLHIEYRTLKRRIRELDALGILEREYTVDNRTGQRKLYIRVVPQNGLEDELQDQDGPQSKPKKKKKGRDKSKEENTNGFSEEDIRADSDFQEAELILKKYFRQHGISPKLLTAGKRFETLCELITDESFDFEAYCAWYKEQKYRDKGFSYGLFLYSGMIEEFQDSQEKGGDTYLTTTTNWESEECKEEIRKSNVWLKEMGFCEDKDTGKHKDTGKQA